MGKSTNEMAIFKFANSYFTRGQPQIVYFHGISLINHIFEAISLWTPPKFHGVFSPLDRDRQVVSAPTGHIFVPEGYCWVIRGGTSRKSWIWMKEWVFRGFQCIFAMIRRSIKRST